MDKVLFESKAWQIVESEGMIFVVNKRFESEGRYEACTEVTASMVEDFEIKGVKVPKYLREELALVFMELEALEKQETEMEFVGVELVGFDIHSNDRPARIYRDQYGLFTSFKYKDVYTGERLGFICLTEKAFGGLMITFDPHNLAKYRDGRNTLEEYQATLEPKVEEAPEEAPRLTIAEIKGYLEGWILNGQIPTGKTVSYIWKGKDIGANEMKYTFLQGLDFENQIVVFGKSERDAWNQLYRILMTPHDSRLEDEMETPFEVAPEASKAFIEQRNNTFIVHVPHGQYALVTGRQYSIHYEDKGEKFFFEDMLFLGCGAGNDRLLFGDSFENILHMNPEGVQQVLVDIFRQK